MKLTANNILNIYHTLTILADKELDLNTACTIAKNIRELDVLKNIIEQKRDTLIQEYAEKDVNGTIIPADDNGNIKITDTHQFMMKMEEILNTELDVSLDTISKTALKDIKISPKDIFPLMDILAGED